MDTPLYIETTKITNDTQLKFQEHKLEELITKQINTEYGLNDILMIVTLLLAIGAMMITLIGNRIASFANGKGIDYWSLAIAGTILFGCLYYGCKAHNKEINDRQAIQKQIEQTIKAIEVYKQKPSGNSK